MEEEKKKYYRIRAELLGLLAGGMIVLLLGACFKVELYEKWLKSGGLQDLSYEGKSRLKNAGACYLCSSCDYSLVDYYRKFDSIGLLSLNDWYVLEFRLMCRDENGNEMNIEDVHSSMFGNTEESCILPKVIFMGQWRQLK